MTDEELIARLREQADKRRKGNRFDSMEYEAADRIEALLARIERLELVAGEARGAQAGWRARAEASEAQIAALTAHVERLTGALSFYADPADYKAPFTGGMGKLWNDCGGTARAALAPAPAPDARAEGMREAAEECYRLAESYTRSLAHYAEDDPERRKIKWGAAAVTVAAENILAAIARMGAGDGLVERATAALEGVTPGPWLYRPDRLDDWGTVKADGCVLCCIRDPERLDEDTLNDFRGRKVDPWEANARFVAFTRQWVPEAASRIAALTATVRESALQELAALGQAHEAYEAQLAAEAERDALRAKVGRLEASLRKAEQDFYEAANRFQDEDYEGPHEKFTVNVVCHIKPYFDMNMKHLRDSAAAARSAYCPVFEKRFYAERPEDQARIEAKRAARILAGLSATLPARGVGVVCTWPSCPHTAKGQCQPSTRILATTDAAQAREAALLEALQWCSGSDDFQEGGKAREGWLKLCAPLLIGEART